MEWQVLTPKWRKARKIRRVGLIRSFRAIRVENARCQRNHKGKESLIIYV
jgi:hypothetical protein